LEPDYEKFLEENRNIRKQSHQLHEKEHELEDKLKINLPILLMFGVLGIVLEQFCFSYVLKWLESLF